MGNNVNNFDHHISEHLDLNNALKETLNTIINLIKKVNSLDDVEKKELVSFFNPWFDTDLKIGGLGIGENSDIAQMKTIFQKLELDYEEIIKMINQIIQTLIIENKLISDYLNQKSVFIGQRKDLIEKLKINYQAEKIRLWQQIRLKLGETSKFEEFEINRSEQNEKMMVKSYMKLYIGLRDLVVNRNSKNEITKHSIYENLKQIEKLLSQITEDYQASFIKCIEGNDDKKFKEEGKQFAENFFPSGIAFKKYFDEYLKYFNEESKTYSSLDEDEKKEFDNVLNDSLEELFKEIPVVNKKIKEVSDKNDVEFKSAMKEYEKQFIKLEELVNNDEDFNSENKLEDAQIYGVSEIENGTSFKNFVLKHIKGNEKKKDIVNNVAIHIKRINNNDQDVAYNNFKKNNNTMFNNGNQHSFSGGKINDGDRDKLKYTYQAISALDSVNEENENEIQNQMSDMLSLLFGELEKELTEKNKNKFNGICKNFEKTTHNSQIDEVFSFLNDHGKINKLLNHDLDTWKEFIVKLSFLLG